MTHWIVRYHSEPSARRLDDGGRELYLVVSADDGRTVDVRVRVEAEALGLVLHDVPAGRLWPAVAQYALMFELPGLANDGALTDGVAVPVSTGQVRGWAIDESEVLVPLEASVEVGKFDSI